MHPNMAADPWNLRNRVNKATRYLSSLPEELLQQAVWARMTGAEDPSLPNTERHEQPADIFIDVVLTDAPDAQELLQRIRNAAASLIDKEARAATLKDPEALAETIFLASRTSSKPALEPLVRLARHPQADVPLSNGERLQSRALRALLGLLITFPAQSADSHRSLFEELKLKGDCVLQCLTGLILFFGADRAAELSQVRLGGVAVTDDQLDLYLSVAGVQLPRNTET